MSFVTRTEFPTKAPLKPFPFHFGNRQSLIRTLETIGFAMPDSVKALAAAAQPLGKDGLKIDIHELDQVLAGYDIPVSKRMQLKSELNRQKLL